MKEDAAPCSFSVENVSVMYLYPLSQSTTKVRKTRKMNWKGQTDSKDETPEARNFKSAQPAVQQAALPPPWGTPSGSREFG